MGEFKNISIEIDNEERERRRRRGKNNRSRGNSIERWVCSSLGIQRVGMFGGKSDGGSVDDPMIVQVKSGGSFPERIWSLLETLKPRANQIRGVVHVTADGVGSRRRAIISFDFDDFVALSPTLFDAIKKGEEK